MTRKTRVLSFIIAGTVAVAAALCYTLHRSDRRAGIAEVRDRDKVMNFERSMRVDVGNDISLTPHGAFDYSSELLPIVGKSGEYVLIHRDTMSRGNNTNGRYVRNFKTLERWVSAFMRNDVGVKGFGHSVQPLRAA